jgi:hypothetical protein
MHRCHCYITHCVLPAPRDPDMPGKIGRGWDSLTSPPMGFVEHGAPIQQSHKKAKRHKRAAPRMGVPSNPIKSLTFLTVIKSPERQHILGNTTHAWFRSRQKTPNEARRQNHRPDCNPGSNSVDQAARANWLQASTRRVESRLQTTTEFDPVENSARRVPYLPAAHKHWPPTKFAQTWCFPDTGRALCYNPLHYLPRMDE